VTKPLRFGVRRPSFTFDEVSTASNRASVLAFALQKGGSTLLYDVLRMMSAEVGLTFVSYPDQLFLKGVAPMLTEPAANFSRTGFCYGGFRSFPHFPVPLMETAKAN
jgi:hypothetical protein